MMLDFASEAFRQQYGFTLREVKWLERKGLLVRDAEGEYTDASVAEALRMYRPTPRPEVSEPPRPAEHFVRSWFSPIDRELF